MWQYDQAGQPLFSWRAPNGYSDLREDWQSATPRVMSWRLCNWLMDVEDDSDNHYANVLAQTPAGVRTANEIADFWIDRVLGRPMPPADRLEIVEFMAQGHNPDFDLAPRLRLGHPGTSAFHGRADLHVAGVSLEVRMIIRPTRRSFLKGCSAAVAGVASTRFTNLAFGATGTTTKRFWSSCFCAAAWTASTS